jgi:excisionase family DNA binding protein
MFADMDTDELLTVQQVADRKGITRLAIYKAIREGRLASVEYFGRRLVKVADADAYTPNRGGPRPGSGRKPKSVQGEGNE